MLLEAQCLAQGGQGIAYVDFDVNEHDYEFAGAFFGPIVVEQSQHGLFRATTQSASVAEMSALCIMILSFVRHVSLGEVECCFPALWTSMSICFRFVPGHCRVLGCELAGLLRVWRNRSAEVAGEG